MDDQNQAFEQAIEQRDKVLQEGTARMSDLTASVFDMWMKQFSVGASIAHYWGDTLTTMQRSASQIAWQAQKTLDEQNRRIP